MLLDLVVITVNWFMQVLLQDCISGLFIGEWHILRRHSSIANQAIMHEDIAVIQYNVRSWNQLRVFETGWSFWHVLILYCLSALY